VTVTMRGDSEVTHLALDEATPGSNAGMRRCHEGRLVTERGTGAADFVATASLSQVIIDLRGDWASVRI